MSEVLFIFNGAIYEILKKINVQINDISVAVLTGLGHPHILFKH